MHLTVLERDCHMYATFQSHNQKVVQNRHGIFLSYLSRYDEESERGLPGVDGGRLVDQQPRRVFATRRSDPASPLYYVSRANGGRIGALVSHDHGEIWKALEAGEPVARGRGIYSVGGCREVTPDGFIIGAFTAQDGKRGDPHFFKIAATGVSPP